MKTSSIVAVLAVGVVFASVGYAKGGNEGRGLDLTCPSVTQVAIDTEFGAAVDGTLTSDMTQCLGVRSGIKVAVNVSNDALNSASKANQQINNVKNMVENYENMYGLTAGEDGYRLVVIAHGKGGKFLLDGAAYDRIYGTTGGNDATINVVKGLMAKGVKVFMCQNTMRANNYKTADLIPGVEEVPGGVTAVADYGMRNWVVLTP